MTAKTFTVTGGTGSYTFSDQHISGGVYDADPLSLVGDMVTAINNGGGLGVTSVIGTANQVSASTTSGAVTLTLPAAVVAPGSVAVTTTLGVTGAATFSNLVGLNSYAKASLPSATAVGQVIYVNDATGAHVTGSLCFANATGTANWIDVTTGIAVV